MIHFANEAKSYKIDWVQINHRTRIARNVGFHIRWIVLKNVIYLLVRNIHTYPLYEFNLAIQNVLYIQSNFRG